MIKLCKITAYPNGTLGLHLSRAPWDPYPWVSAVQDGSNAYHAGVRSGDALLELNGSDVLGQKISELAAKIQNHWKEGSSFVTMLIWRNKTENNAVNQESLQKFAKCLQSIAQLLECPICLEIVKPPGWQCCNGHVLCNSCRGRTVKCPICRVTLGPRGRCLLSDKLFTLLAESFPCDNGVKDGNSLSKNYNDCHETPLIKAEIDHSPLSTSSSCSFPSPTLEKVHQRKQLTGNTILNHLEKPDDNDNNKVSADSNSTSDDVNIVVLKLNQKSRKKNDFVNQNGSCSLPSPHHYHNHHHHHYHHQQHHHQHVPHCCAVVGQQELTYHCPTGKSSCSDQPQPNTDPNYKVKTLDCIWTQDINRRKLKGEEKFETSGKFITKWDILSHLTQVHQISVAQHYTDFGQAVQLQLQNFKSIPCITIQSECNWSQDKENLRDVFMSSGSCCSEKIQGHRRHKMASCPKNVHRPSTELFFVACIPLEDDDTHMNETTKTDVDLKEDEGTRNSMSDVSSHSIGDKPLPSSNAVGYTPVVVGSPKGPYTGVINIETKSKPTQKCPHSQATGHLIQDTGSESSSYSSSLQSRQVKHSSITHTCTGYRNSSLQVDACCTRCSLHSPSLSLSSSPLPTSTSSSSSSLASFSMSSLSSRCCSDTMSRQHAIFIWYFGSESDVKNFQTVIECKRTGLKWTGCVHPLTKSWSSLQRQHQQHMDQQYLVLNSMPDGGDNFFDIVIKIK